jgi:hypothetical protein
MPHMVDSPGMYQMAVDDYHADPAPEPSLSHSLALTLLDRCPAYAMEHHPRLGGLTIESTKKQDNGTIAHLILTGQGRNMDIIHADSYRSGEARERRDKSRERGHTPVLIEDLHNAQAMVAAAQVFLKAQNADHAFNTGTGHCELAAIVKDVAGCWTRCLIDFFGHDHAATSAHWECWDYKTTSGAANPLTLRSHMTRMGWAVQAAFQERIITQLKPELAGRIKFRFLVQENEAPYCCSIVTPSGQAMVVAHKMVAAAINIWTQCLARDVWPGYRSIAEIGIYPYVEAGWIARELEDEALGALLAKDPWLNKAIPHAATTAYSLGELLGSTPPSTEHANPEFTPDIDKASTWIKAAADRISKAAMEGPPPPKRRPGRPRKVTAPPAPVDDALPPEPPPEASARPPEPQTNSAEQLSKHAPKKLEI